MEHRVWQKSLERERGKEGSSDQFLSLTIGDGEGGGAIMDGGCLDDRGTSANLGWATRLGVRELKLKTNVGVGDGGVGGDEEDDADIERRWR